MLASRFERPGGSPKAVLLKQGHGQQARARPAPQVVIEGDAVPLVVGK